MNRGHGRFVVCACLTLLLGCGARTSTLEDELGGDNAGGAAGSVPAAGANQGGANQGGAHPTPTAGAPNGGFASAGLGNGGAGAAGAGVGGSTPTAGAPAGGAGAAGASGVGGEAGNIGELCSVLGGNSCAACACKSCAPSIQACFSDLGCTGIFICAQQSGCSGLNCYSPSTCQTVIDQAGGLGGASLSKVFALLTCSGTAQSTCGC